jgi:hypothetical protein
MILLVLKHLGWITDFRSTLNHDNWIAAINISQ